MKVKDKETAERLSHVLHPPAIKWLVEPTFDDDGVQRTAGLSVDGEHGDPVPMAPPVGLNVSQGDELHAALRNMFIRERELWKAAIEAEQFESEDEANDFLVAEDLFPPGNEPWEDIFEFPADEPPRSGSPTGEVGNGAKLASGAVQGENRGPVEPTPPPTPADRVPEPVVKRSES